MHVRELTPDTLEEAASFIARHEERSIALMSHLVAGTALHMPEPQFHYYLYRKDRNASLCAVICYSENGLVLHRIDDAVYEDSTLCGALQHDIKNALRQIPLFCILGEQTGSSFIAGCTLKHVKTRIDYQLMIWKDTGIAPVCPENMSVVRCTEADADMLFPLQKDYDLVEVLQPGDSFNQKACMMSLHRNLRIQHIYALRKPDVLTVSGEKLPGPFAAKAGTNAIGRGWVQLGGVYTCPESRCKGYAAFLVEHIAREAQADGKKTALFVKTANAPAKAAYMAAHFHPGIPFQIIYY